MYLLRLAPDKAGVEHLGGDVPAAVLLVATTFRASTADPLPEAPSEIKIQPVGGAEREGGDGNRTRRM